MNKETINKTIETLKDIADILYKGNTKKGMAMINDVISDLEVIYTYFDTEDMQYRFVNDGLAPLLQAMENEAAVDMADIISYELLDMINRL